MNYESECGQRFPFSNSRQIAFYSTSKSKSLNERFNLEIWDEKKILNHRKSIHLLILNFLKFKSNLQQKTNEFLRNFEFRFLIRTKAMRFDKQSRLKWRISADLIDSIFHWLYHNWSILTKKKFFLNVKQIRLFK